MDIEALKAQYKQLKPEDQIFVTITGIVLAAGESSVAKSYKIDCVTKAMELVELNAKISLITALANSNFKINAGRTVAAAIELCNHFDKLYRELINLAGGLGNIEMDKV